MLSKTEKGLIVLVAFLVILISLFLANKPTLTGEVISEIVTLDKSVYEPEELIFGSVSLKFDDADLIPRTSVVHLLIEQYESEVIPEDDDEVEYSPPPPQEEGEGEDCIASGGQCCYPGTGLGTDYGNLDCVHPYTECWSSCSEIKTLSLVDFIADSNNAGKGDYRIGYYNNVDGNNPVGNGHGFSGCPSSYSECSLVGGTCATSCNPGFHQDTTFSCISTNQPGDMMQSPPDFGTEGESESEGEPTTVCCIHNEYDTECELSNGVCTEECISGYHEDSSLSCEGDFPAEGELICCVNSYSCENWNNRYTTSIPYFDVKAPSSPGQYTLTMQLKQSEDLGSVLLYSDSVYFEVYGTGEGEGEGDDGNGGGGGEGESEAEAEAESESEGEIPDYGTGDQNGDTISEEERQSTIWFVLIPSIAIVAIAIILIFKYRKKGPKIKPKNLKKQANYPTFGQTLRKR